MVAVEAFGGGLANATACGAADWRRARNRVRYGGESKVSADGEQAVLLDGRMIDRPIEDRARRWLAR
jgi:citrate lyase beta subunit